MESPNTERKIMEFDDKKLESDEQKSLRTFFESFLCSCNLSFIRIQQRF